MTKFDQDYEIGKNSEIESHSDLENIFKCKLVHDPETFAHFDFQGEDIYVELKTRPCLSYENNKFYYTNEKTEDKREIDSLYFDSPKKWFAYKRRNTNIKFYIVWKISGKYFYWKINHDKKDYYIEPQFRDCGHGYKQPREVINVFTSAVTIAPYYKLSFE